MKYFKTELIENFREEKGWSVKTFCEECEISLLTYIKVINQQIDFSSKVLYKIANTIGVKIGDLCCFVGGDEID